MVVCPGAAVFAARVVEASGMVVPLVVGGGVVVDDDDDIVVVEVTL